MTGVSSWHLLARISSWEYQSSRHFSLQSRIYSLSASWMQEAKFPSTNSDGPVEYHVVMVLGSHPARSRLFCSLRFAFSTWSLEISCLSLSSSGWEVFSRVHEERRRMKKKERKYFIAISREEVYLAHTIPCFLNIFGHLVAFIQDKHWSCILWIHHAPWCLLIQGNICSYYLGKMLLKFRNILMIWKSYPEVFLVNSWNIQITGEYL